MTFTSIDTSTQNNGKLYWLAMLAVMTLTFA